MCNTAESEASFECRLQRIFIVDVHRFIYRNGNKLQIKLFCRLLFAVAATAATAVVLVAAVTIIVIHVVVVVVVVVTPLRFRIYRSIDLGAKKGKYANTHAPHTCAKRNKIQ